MASISETLSAIPRKPGRWTIAGLPEGADALALAELARTTGGQDILHVARDGQRLERLQDGLRFFAPERDVLVFPAWDCLPYDRMSPHPDIVAERLETLVRLAAPKKPGAPARIILASVGAALQSAGRAEVSVSGGLTPATGMPPSRSATADACARRVR